MLASGMSVQFFPLFFWRSVNLSPTGVYLVAALSFAAVTPMALAAQRASLCLGRVCVSVLYNLCGVSLLLLMAYWRELELPHALVSVAYVFRTGFMNSTGGLVASILNDHVPKAQRARWNVLDSFKRASWSGSSVLGGVLIERIGYEHMFLVTASMQVLASLLLLPLLRIVRAEKGARRG